MSDEGSGRAPEARRGGASGDGPHPGARDLVRAAGDVGVATVGLVGAGATTVARAITRPRVPEVVKRAPGATIDAGRRAAERGAEVVQSASGRIGRGGDASAPAEPTSARPAAKGGVVSALVGRAFDAIDVNALVARIDVKQLVDQVDVQGLVDRVDLNKVVAKVDLSPVVASVDPNALIAKVDVDAALERVDLGGVAKDVLEEIDFGDIVRESTMGMGTQAVTALRLQAARADDLTNGFIDRLLRRGGDRGSAPLLPPRS